MIVKFVCFKKSSLPIRWCHVSNAVIKQNCLLSAWGPLLLMSRLIFVLIRFVPWDHVIFSVHYNTTTNHCSNSLGLKVNNYIYHSLIPMKIRFQRSKATGVLSYFFSIDVKFIIIILRSSKNQPRGSNWDKKNWKCAPVSELGRVKKCNKAICLCVVYALPARVWSE